MYLDDYFMFIRLYSAYQTVKDKSSELLTNNVTEKFKFAWNEDGRRQNASRFPVYMRIGKVGN